MGYRILVNTTAVLAYISMVGLFIPGVHVLACLFFVVVHMAAVVGCVRRVRDLIAADVIEGKIDLKDPYLYAPFKITTG